MNNNAKLIRNFYEKHDMTVSEIAFRLNMSRTSVHRVITKYGMKNSRTRGRTLVPGATRIASGSGYMETFAPWSPMASPDGFVMTHDLIMSAIIGRPLAPDEVVHHIDGNKLNNDPRNLALMTRAEHTRLHSKARWAAKKGVVA